ncbi:hypothetical protein WKI68_18345 [Streptomyces sp. MS1.HAVA.3]|uniref:Uncharacterized protein n=1 Tax=Streptomyces caledonius TaxID=3134107 RepID=A0ABU8U4N5_9ACTN
MCQAALIGSAGMGPPAAYTVARAPTARYPQSTAENTAPAGSTSSSSSDAPPSRAARRTSSTGSATRSRGVTPTGAGTPDRVSYRTSSVPWASSHSPAARWSAPPGPLSG